MKSRTSGRDFILSIKLSKEKLKLISYVKEVLSYPISLTFTVMRTVRTKAKLYTLI